MLLDRQDGAKLFKGQAELEYALMQEDIAEIEQLVRETPRLVNLKDKNGRTPLYFAAREANMEATHFFLANHATVDAKDRWGRTPLFAAVYEEPLVFDHTPIVTLLIKNGADVTLKDDRGDTPLHLAASLGTDVIPLLLQQGADVNAINDAGETPLHKAAYYPEYGAVRELLRHGGDKSIRSAQGLTPVQVAEQRGWTNLVELFNSVPVEREAA